MGVHLYTNGTWTDSGRIYRNSLNEYYGSITNNKYIDGDGNEQNGIYPTYSISYIKIDVSENETYSYSFINNLAGIRAHRRINAFDSDGQFIAPIVDIYPLETDNYNSANFTTPINCSYITINFVNQEKNNGDTEQMLNLGSTALPYEPYNVVDWYTNNGHGYTSGAWS